jgi:chromosomal replication initiator protein
MDDFSEVPPHAFNDRNTAQSGGADKSILTENAPKIRAMLRARLGEEVYSSWFNTVEFDGFDGKVVKVSVPVHFLQKWLRDHYLDVILACSAVHLKGAERVEVLLRQHGAQAGRPVPAATSGTRPATASPAATPAHDQRAKAAAPTRASALPMGRTGIAGFDGSPLDPRLTFDTFVVGPANRMAHAGAIQVAETVHADDRGFNPLVIHSTVGLGKTHLLQAIAWDVKRRSPNAQVLYLTAERFRFDFVGALRSQDGLAFKDKFHAVDILLIDDLEFMQGEKTEQEFEHIVNTMLDSGRQVVVASSRAPNQLERVSDRMRSRLQRGLVTEVQAFDQDLRIKILDKRLHEKRSVDPSFEIPRAVIEMLADRLVESGRELEGAVNRLYAQWQVMRQPVSVESTEAIIRDLVQGIEPRRIKIEDILRIIARHYAVSKADILSERRHRSVVLPRQIGMYLAKQLTARSLPEIGRRFGDRDHTTVLHAIRKIDKEIETNTRMRDEIEELKRLLNR